MAKFLGVFWDFIFINCKQIEENIEGGVLTLKSLPGHVKLRFRNHRQNLKSRFYSILFFIITQLHISPPY